MKLRILEIVFVFAVLSEAVVLSVAGANLIQQESLINGRLKAIEAKVYATPSPTPVLITVSPSPKAGLLPRATGSGVLQQVK